MLYVRRCQRTSSATKLTVVVVAGAADPRQWTRSDVITWLRVHHRDLNVDVSRFAMNGRALCIMTPAMFRYRVGPRRGSALFNDFRRRLLAAVVAQCSSN